MVWSVKQVRTFDVFEALLLPKGIALKMCKWYNMGQESLKSQVQALSFNIKSTMLIRNFRFWQSF